MGLFNFDNTLDWVGKNESDGEIFYGYNNGEGRNMKLVERQIDLIKKNIDDLSKVIERDESISDVNELKNIVSFWKEVRNDFELKFIKGQAFTAKDKIKEFDKLVAVFEKTIFKIDEVEKIIINRFEKIREILKNKHKLEIMHIDVIENEYSYDVRWDIDDLNNYWNGMLQGLQDIVDNAENNIKNNFVNGISKMVLEYLRTQRIMFKKFIDKI